LIFVERKIFELLISRPVVINKTEKEKLQLYQKLNFDCWEWK